MAVKVSKQEYSVVLFLVTLIMLNILGYYIGFDWIITLVASAFISVFITIIYWYK